MKLHSVPSRNEGTDYRRGDGTGILVEGSGPEIAQAHLGNVHRQEGYRARQIINGADGRSGKTYPGNAEARSLEGGQ